MARHNLLCLAGFPATGARWRGHGCAGMGGQGLPARKPPFAIATKLTLDVINAKRYVRTMIKSFGCKDTEKIFQREYVRKLPHDIQRVAMRKLWMIDAAPDLNSLRVPSGNRLEALSGNRLGHHSIRINDQWRICFRWHGGNAYDVEIVDYH